MTRLLRFVRPYLAPLVLSVVLMAAVGAAQGFMALLIGPIFDRVLQPETPDSLVPLFTIPLFNHKVYLQQFVPSSIHNVWTMVAIAILGVFLVKGLCDYFGNYFINYVGFPRSPICARKCSTACSGRTRTSLNPTPPAA
jgi:subfamily B ATP-binding cassette protein MsbA